MVLASGEEPSSLPLVVARDQDHRKSLLIAFDPHDSNFPQQSAFPLLMAGTVEWMTHPIEDASDSLFAGELDLPGPAARVIGPNGADVPFARNGSYLHILALDTGIYRVMGANRNSSFAVNAPPLLPSQRLDPTESERAAVQTEAIAYQGSYLWRTMAIFAIIALWLEWWLFYSPRVNRQAELVQRMYLDTESSKRPTVVEREAEHDETLDPNFIT
jgi:hypothetical protein